MMTHGKFVCIFLCILAMIALISGCDRGTDDADKSDSAVNGYEFQSEIIDTQDDKELQDDAVSIVNIPYDYASVMKNGMIYYPIEYSVGTETYTGYLSDSGEILSEEVLFQNTRDGSTLQLYDEKGNVSYTQENTPHSDGVQCVGDNGVFLWREVISDIDNYSVMMGLKDSYGEWLFDPIDVYAVAGVEFLGNYKFYLGEGMFAAYDLSKLHGNSLIVFDSENGGYFYLEDVYAHNMAFYNGTMIYQQWDGGQAGGHLGAICSVTRNGEVTTLNTEGDLMAVNEEGFLTDNAISFYNREGGLKWKFDRYEMAPDSGDFDCLLLCVVV